MKDHRRLVWGLIAIVVILHVTYIGVHLANRDKGRDPEFRREFFAMIEQSGLKGGQVEFGGEEVPGEHWFEAKDLNDQQLAKLDESLRRFLWKEGFAYRPHGAGIFMSSKDRTIPMTSDGSWRRSGTRIEIVILDQNFFMSASFPHPLVRRSAEDS